jgi:DNA polymerase elongation subunit (family B)
MMEKENVEKLEQIKLLEEKIESLTSLKNDLKNEEQAIKLTMNSIYGAIGNNWFVCFNPDVAESVTLQGQDLIKYSEKIIFKYFSEFWDKDTELHQKLGITSARKITSPMTVYGDTDSATSSTLVISKFRDKIKKIRFDDLFEFHSYINGTTVDERGNEIVEPVDLETLNSSGDSSDYVNVRFSGVRKIIRHRVSKSKWKIVLESGREVEVTNDHSLMVFRNGKKISVKASEVQLDVDLMLTVDFNSKDY